MRIVGQAWTDLSADLPTRARAFGALPPRWGKYAPLVRAGWLAVAAALREAQGAREVAPARTGIIACGLSGSQAANRRYFADYAESGRTLSRSSLFVYTLPTTPIAEYAIHFGLGGPLLYAGFESGRIEDALAVADSFLASGEAERMVVLIEDGRSALGLAVEAGDAAAPAWATRLIAELFEFGKGISA